MARDPQPFTPLFDQISSEQVLVAPCADVDIIGHLQGIAPMPESKLDRAPSVVVHEFKPNQPRNIRDAFSFLTGRTLNLVTIHDPNALKDQVCAQKLEGFLELLKNLVPALTDEQIAIRYRTDMGTDSRSEETKFKQKHPKIRLLARMPNTGDFHDRRVEFQLIKPPTPGKGLKVRGGVAAQPLREFELMAVDVSGGISRLMEQRFECRLYRYPVA
jgi:hypothetical protein